MTKKIALIALFVCLLAGLYVPGAARAADELAVTQSSAEMDFPMRLIFNISAAGSVDITDIRLSYVVNRLEHARIVSEIRVGFTPSPAVTAQWVWDMRKTGGLPPGSSVDYWWQVTDSGGEQVTTVPARIEIKDNRYQWRSIAEGQVTLYWYKGDDSFAAGLMAAVQQALSRLAENTGAELKSQISLYIYASSSDLQGSMIYPQEWTGGVAFTRYGIIAIGIGTSSSELAWGKRTIVHELTHLVVHQVTFNPYNDLPTWLDEGLAMTAEGEIEPEFADALAKARENNTLISVRSLASPFSAFGGEALLAYAESYELVAYLIDNYGREKMLELLNTFAQGSGYDEALEKVYGFDMDGLNALWRASLEGAAVR